MRTRPRLLTAMAAGAAALTVAIPAQACSVPNVRPTVETPALFDDDAGGNANADDPAIWLHPSNPGKSVVVATAKQGGLRAYTPAGRTLQSLPAPEPPRSGDEPGRFNNVDLLYGMDLGATESDVAVVSDRGRDQLRIYRIDPDAALAGEAPLTDVTDPRAPLVFSSSLDEVNDQYTAYGLATWHDHATGDDYALVSRRHTSELALLRLVPTAAGTVTYEVVRTLTLPNEFTLPDGTTWSPCQKPDRQAQVEGMVVDAETGELYAGQEDVGIWKVSASLKGTPTLVDKVREYGVPGTYDPATDECVLGEDPGFGGSHISADVEGLTMYYRGHGKGYLLASSQGDYTFAAYERQGDNDYLASFRIAAHHDPSDPDGSEVCDGAAVLNSPLGGKFGKGMMAVQDGVNTPTASDGNGEERENTNFKFVQWDDIARRVGLRVDTTGWNPRG